MPQVAFVMSARQPQTVRDLAVTLGDELESQAVPSSLHLGSFPEPRQNLVYVLLDPDGYLAQEGQAALPAEGILRRTIFICTEPPPAGADRDDRHVALLRKAGSVFALGRRSVLAMHRLGVPARLISPGYAKSLDRFDPTAPRPIDVLFIGAYSPRRANYLSRAARVLARHNCVLRISEDIPKAGEPDEPEDRWSLLTRAKVLISLHRDEQSRFDWARALDAIHAGAVFVSEPAGGLSPLVVGEHVLLSSPDSLPYVVEDLLGDEQRLARLRSAAYERLRAWSPYALPVAVLRAAIVELVGEPLPSSAGLGRPRSEPAGGTASPHAAPDLPSAARPSEATRVEVVHESPAWGARRVPRVSALLTLDDQDGQVVGTLDSLAQSRLRDFELVLVDWSDGAHNRGCVTDWISAHPEIASRLVRANATGRAAAGNAGLHFARAAFVLILAPGQELYPRCLGELSKTLEATPDDVAFTYPIEAVTGNPNGFAGPAGDYLLSYLDWKPQHVRDVHTPALVRTGQLRRLGGFAGDEQPEGFEDCDLWRRIVAQGWRGQLVPQALARRLVVHDNRAST